MFGLIGTVIVGFIVGVIAKLITPAKAPAGSVPPSAPWCSCRVT